jgi:hypothetical protein
MSPGAPGSPSGPVEPVHAVPANASDNNNDKTHECPVSLIARDGISAAHRRAAGIDRGTVSIEIPILP